MKGQPFTSRSVFDYVLLCAQREEGSYSGGQYQVDCPNPVHKDSRLLYVEPRRHLYICFSCGLRGTFRDLVAEDPARWLPVRRLCDGMHGVTKTRRRLDDRELCPLVESDSRIFSSQRNAAYNYCLSRGMTPAQISDYRVSLLPCNKRVWFPVWDTDGHTMFRMGRTIGEPATGEPKTLEDMEVNEKPLYGSHLYLPNGVLALVEGVFDHFATPDSYALLGSYVTEHQRWQLSSWQRMGFFDRAFFLLDPDAKDKARRLVPQLRNCGVVVAAAFLEGTGSDPAKIGPVVMQEIMRHLRTFDEGSIRASQFLTVNVRI